MYFKFIVPSATVQLGCFGNATSAARFEVPQITLMMIAILSTLAINWPLDCRLSVFYHKPTNDSESTDTEWNRYLFHFWISEEDIQKLKVLLRNLMNLNSTCINCINSNTNESNSYLLLVLALFLALSVDSATSLRKS